MKGMRVKLTFSFTALGVSAPMFITVTGLDESELPLDTSLLVKVKGLSIGGGGVNMENESVGYLLFMRKKENADLVRYSFYQKNVLFPFIKKCREEYDDFSSNTFTPDIPDKLTSSSWCDGDIKQIESIVNDIDGYNNLKVAANKHNPARSGSEQPCDKTKTFKLVNKLQTEYTCSDVPAARHPMKKQSVTSLIS